MGTSISQSSPRNTNWSPVHAGYRSKDIPEERIVREIWRAFDNEVVPISTTLKEEVFYDCYNTIKGADNAEQAVQSFDSVLMEKKHNSMVAEFSKRALALSFFSGDPVANWKTALFVQVTDYVISRDISGFVGDKYRNKTIGDVIRFKDSIALSIDSIVRTDQLEINSKRDWNSFVERTIKKLKTK